MAVGLELLTHDQKIYCSVCLPVRAPSDFLPGINLDADLFRDYL
jgi:hypothetical protein